jgi:hypothetical protein
LQSYTLNPATQYFAAPTGAQLAAIYTQIAGDLQQTAGGNTKVTLDYGTVNINGALGNILDYMDYVPVLHLPAQASDSTYVMKKNMTKTGVETLVYQYSRDDTANWTAKNMQFDVGEMQLNETWATSFRVNLTQAGQISMFGPASPSQVCFTDASTGVTTCQKFPPWECPVQQQKIDVGFGNRNLSLDSLTVTPSAGNPSILAIRWNVTYDGDKTAQQTVTYQNTNKPGSIPVTAPPIQFDSAGVQKQKVLTVDTTNWASGTYRFTVDAVATDAKRPMPLSAIWTKQATSDKTYIKLE